jgi:3,4-dihydroxy 2-butanone 4-phosphate synthase / GTP cyclohydrolase II
MTADVRLSPFSEVLSDFKQGRPVIMVDAVDRENEGDIVVATEKLDPQDVSFMMQHARGLICVSIPSETAAKLNLPLQVINNNSPFNTPFTVSIDHKEVAATGVDGRSRTFTMRKIIDPDSGADDFVSPGHVFPLVANPAGVIGRQGQTEGSYDLARITGLTPSSVICEILNPDGTMCRGSELNKFADQHNLKICSVEDVIKYRVHHEVLLRKVADSVLETDYGRFRTFIFEDDVEGKEHLALVYGDIQSCSVDESILVRIHSECLTGDVFGSKRCDCGEQLAMSAKQIVSEGKGIILYLRQEGRGIGLGNKLKAYQLQDTGDDTFDANVKLGFPPDSRNYAVAAWILQTLKVERIRLMTNNPDKIDKLGFYGIEIEKRVPVVVEPTEYSRFYLDTKKEKFGHML